MFKFPPKLFFHITAIVGLGLHQTPFCDFPHQLHSLLAADWTGKTKTVSSQFWIQSYLTSVEAPSLSRRFPALQIVFVRTVHIPDGVFQPDHWCDKFWGGLGVSVPVLCHTLLISPSTSTLTWVIRLFWIRGRDMANSSSFNSASLEIQTIANPVISSPG